MKLALKSQYNGQPLAVPGMVDAKIKSDWPSRRLSSRTPGGEASAYLSLGIKAGGTGFMEGMQTV